MSERKDQVIMSVNKLDERGIEYSEYNGRKYYNRTYAAQFVQMTDTGLRRKMDKLKKEQGITIPLVILPHNRQNKYIDRRVLEQLVKSVRSDREHEWFEELRKVVDDINKEE